MEEKITPGKWEILTDLKGCRKIGSAYCKGEITPLKVVCEINLFNNEHEENTKLIVAAPVMLEDIKAYIFRVPEWIELLNNGNFNDVITQLKDFKDHSETIIN